MQNQTELDAVLAQILAQGGYGAILCATSAEAPIERRLLLAARAAGIPTIAFCDMGWAYEERFSKGGEWALPDTLWVIDTPMADTAKGVAWPAPVAIRVVGSPLFADLLARRKTDRSTARAVRFISEPASTKFPDAKIDEYRVANEIVAAVSKALPPGTSVIVRPHPTESVESWRRWCFDRRSLGAQIDTLPLEAAIADTAFAIGIASTLLVEMRLCGVAAASFQSPGTDGSYYCLPFEDLGIARVTDSDELQTWLGQTHGPLAPLENDHSLAIERATDLLLDVLYRGI